MVNNLVLVGGSAYTNLIRRLIPGLGKQNFKISDPNIKEIGTQTNMSYAVVCFLDECQGDSEVVQEVPICWLRNNNTMCMWPPSNSSYHIINSTPPMVSWKLCSIRCDRICDSLADARRRCTESSSEDERGRGLRKKILSKHLIGHNPKCPSPPSIEDHSSEDSGYRIQEIGTLQPENIPHSLPPLRISEPNNNYTHRTDQVSVEHNENIHDPWHQPLVHVLNSQHRPDLTPVEHKGNLPTLERKIDKLTDLVGRILVEIESMKDQRERNEPLHNEFRNNFPFHSIDSVKEFDKQLNDEDQKKKLTEYFRSIGGLSAKDLHTRAMTKLFTNSLAMTCSWKGFKQNHKIEGLMIMQCLYDAISAEYPTTLKEFEILTRDWLRHAKQRNARMAP